MGVAAPITGAVIVVLAAAVILGGIKSIGRVTSLFVPVMIVIYIVGAAAVLAFNIGEVPAALATIFSDAFTGTSATGGFAGRPSPPRSATASRAASSPTSRAWAPAVSPPPRRRPPIRSGRRWCP